LQVVGSSPGFPKAIGPRDWHNPTLPTRLTPWARRLNQPTSGEFQFRDVIDPNDEWIFLVFCVTNGVQDRFFVGQFAFRSGLRPSSVVRTLCPVLLSFRLP